MPLLDSPRTAPYPDRMRPADLLAPMPLEEFETEIFGRRPVHIPAPNGGHAKIPIGWARLNDLLALRPHWTEANLKLILNSRSVPPALYLGIHLVEGETLTPMLLARRFTLNPVLIILSLVFWFWMWGVPGAILAVPMLAILKIISDRLRPLKALGHFLEGE